MMNAVKKNACALTVLAATTSTAVLADSVDVKVIGTIRPTACKPSLSGGGTIDYGTITAKSLKMDGYTLLDEKQLDFAITCDGPTKVALKAVNGRPNSVASGTNADDGAGGAVMSPTPVFGGNTPVAGLGLDGSSRIGGYGIRIASGSVTADGKTVDGIYRDGNGRWTLTETGPTAGALYGITLVRNQSWAEPGTKFPTAFTTLTGKLSIQAYLSKAPALDLTKPVSLDGLTTIELVYL